MNDVLEVWLCLVLRPQRGPACVAAILDEGHAAVLVLSTLEHVFAVHTY